MTTTQNALSVGDKFIRTDSRSYRVDGVQHHHITETLNEVTSVNAVGFKSTVVSVISETGRPTFAGTPTGCDYAWFGWDAAVARGDACLVSA